MAYNISLNTPIRYYGLTDEGCTSCGCDVDGSVEVACHHMAGGCQCKNNVQGPQCNKCKEGLLWFYKAIHVILMLTVDVNKFMFVIENSRLESHFFLLDTF